MSVIKLNPRDAQALVEGATTIGPESRTTFFDVFGTSNCLLNCESERTLDRSIRHKIQFVSNSKADERKVRAARKEFLLEFRKNREEWFNVNKITASSVKGCGSCTILKQIIETVFSSAGQSLSDIYEYSVSQEFLLRRRKLGTEHPVEAVQLFQPPGQFIRFHRLTQSKFLVDRATSITRLRRWIDTCEATHDHCAKHGAAQDDTSRPARLLDVSPLIRHGEAGIKLVATISGSSYQYTCLSHRWDKVVEATRTTQANLAVYQDFLNLGSLPKNVCDAIAIARDLQIQYLWVDSLCIVQHGDGGIDLNRELAKMGAIYRNARLNIMAISSRDSSEGCFIKDKWPDVCFSVSNDKDKDCLIGARVLDKKGRPTSIREVADRYPLLSRAWVFQERLLSSRLLRCSYGEFEYECLESLSCECNSSLAPHPRTTNHLLDAAVKFSHLRSQLLHGASGCFTDGERMSWERNILDYWLSLVKTYTRLSLTYPSDVLPAIAGCAELLANHLQFTYVAGMWKETLATDLLWFVTGQGLKPRPKGVGAPSWSWASVSLNHGIQHIDRTRGQNSARWLTSDALLQQAIKSVHFEPESANNTFGRLKNACIELEAELYPWYLRQCCNVAEREMHTSRLLKRHDLYLNRSSTIQCTTATPALAIGDAEVHFHHDSPVHVEIPDVSITFSNCASGKPYPCALREVFLLHALRKVKQGRTSDVFLLLSQIASINNKPNCYRRVGLVQITSAESDGWTWDDMIRGKMKPLQQEFWLF